MARQIQSVTLSLVLSVLTFGTRATADSELEGKFQDMFVTAGYSAAAGAAIGAALLAFQDEPTRHLKFISVGASLGFLGGTALGSWVALAPIFVVNAQPAPSHFSYQSNQRIVIRPWIDTASRSIAGVEAGAILASF